MAPASYEASIVIPAYNEAAGVERLLRMFSARGGTHRYLIVVVCNGCTDRTPDIARTFHGVVVEDLELPSKSNALNVGDEIAASVFPRLYLDADVVCDLEDIDVLVKVLDTNAPLAVSPDAVFLTSGCTWLVRSYFYGVTHMPGPSLHRRRHVSGRGLYGTNESGRGRFTHFPNVRNDDAFFDFMFGENERVVVSAAVAGVEVPNSAAKLIRGIARVDEGNRQLITWMAENRPDRLIMCQRTERPLGDRIGRYMKHWRNSPVVREFQGIETVRMIVGYIIVKVSAGVFRTWHRLKGSELSWR